MSSRRGQVFSVDLIVATSIYLLALGVLMLTWDYGKTRLDEAADMRELEATANTISDTLVKTSGAPSEWEDDPEHAVSAGLANGDRILGKDKVKALSDSGSVRASELLAVGGRGFEVTLRGLDGGIISRAAGGLGGESSAKSARIVSYDGKPAILEVTVWSRM